MAAKNKNDQDSVGRDRIVSGGAGSVVIGVNATNNTIITGNNNQIGSNSKFSELLPKIDSHPQLSTEDKSDLKSELKTFEDEDKKGPEANEGFLAQRMRNIKRIAPDILEVALATVANPVVGFGVIAIKVAEKMKAEAK